MSGRSCQALPMSPRSTVWPSGHDISRPGAKSHDNAIVRGQKSSFATVYHSSFVRISLDNCRNCTTCGSRHRTFRLGTGSGSAPYVDEGDRASPASRIHWGHMVEPAWGCGGVREVGPGEDRDPTFAANGFLAANSQMISTHRARTVLGGRPRPDTSM